MNSFDVIQGSRELPSHPDKIIFDHNAYQTQAEERKNRDRRWLDSEEGLEELQKPKYRGEYVYIACEGVAGYGDSITNAGAMARRNTGIGTANMIQLLIPENPLISL